MPRDIYLNFFLVGDCFHVVKVILMCGFHDLASTFSSINRRNIAKYEEFAVLRRILLIQLNIARAEISNGGILANFAKNVVVNFQITPFKLYFRR